MNWPLALWILGIGLALVLVGFLVVGVIWLGGIIASAIAKDGADTNDGEPEPWLPPPPPLEMFPPELQAIIVRDSAKLRAEAEATLRDTLGVRDDGKPVESMRPLDDDRATDGRYQREVLGIWPQATPATDPNREVEQADDRGTTAPQADFDDAYWAKIPEQWRRS